MKLKTILLVSITAICFACSDDENLPTVADIVGNYSGYTLASCAYFSNTCTANETISVTENNDGTAKVIFESDSWGDFSISNAQMNKNGGVYTLSGSGQTQMGMGESVSNYDFTMTGTINSTKDNYSISFNVPAVMGGLTVTLLPDTAPATE